MKIKVWCCCFGLGVEVHVLKEDCPLKREEGQRTYESKGRLINDCTCVYESIFSKEDSVPKCKYYNGVVYDKNTNNYLVDCIFN